MFAFSDVHYMILYSLILTKKESLRLLTGREMLSLENDKAEPFVRSDRSHSERKNVCLNIDKSTKHCAGTVLYLGKGSYLFKSVFSKLECDGGSDGEAPSHRIYTVCKPSSSAK